MRWITYEPILTGGSRILCLILSLFQSNIKTAYSFYLCTRAWLLFFSPYLEIFLENRCSDICIWGEITFGENSSILKIQIFLLRLWKVWAKHVKDFYLNLVIEINKNVSSLNLFASKHFCLCLKSEQVEWEII